MAQETIAVPNSAGTASPELKVLAGACDFHHHICDTRFPLSQPGTWMVTDSRVPDYRLLQRRLGLTRNVVVTHVPFPASVADNLVTLNALKAFGRNARGVAIVYPKITGTELKTLADGAAGRIALINSLGNLAGFVDRRHQGPDGKLFSNCSEASG